MTRPAPEHLNRIVTMVALMSRDPDAAADGVRLAEVAERLGMEPADLQRDIRTLTAISDDGAEWLSSLTVWQDGDRVAATSRGPFRRPLRFTPDELLALRLALGLESDGAAPLAARLALPPGREGAPQQPDSVSLERATDGEAAVLALARRAMTEQRVLALRYTGERDIAGSPRDVEPHQIVWAHGRRYLVAWCRRAGAWRHFRADRVLDALLAEARFARREDFVPVDAEHQVFRAAEADDVTVRYSPRVARWLREHHPDVEPQPDGALLVTYRVAEPHWLVRKVLSYGDDAEVIEPAHFRTLVLREVL